MEIGNLYKIVPNPNRNRFACQDNSALFAECDKGHLPCRVTASASFIRTSGKVVEVEHGSIVLILKEFRHHKNEYLALYKNKTIAVCAVDLDEI